MSDVLQAFLASHMPNTRAAYKSDLRDFAAFIGVESAAAAAELFVSFDHGGAHKYATRYKASMLARGLASATIARRLNALRSLVTAARRIGRVTWALDVEPSKLRLATPLGGPDDADWRNDRRCDDAGELADVESPKLRLATPPTGQMMPTDETTAAAMTPANWHRPALVSNRLAISTLLYSAAAGGKGRAAASLPLLGVVPLLRCIFSERNLLASSTSQSMRRERWQSLASAIMFSAS
jgi:hypothetical protein